MSVVPSADLPGGLAADATGAPGPAPSEAIIVTPTSTEDAGSLIGGATVPSPVPAAGPGEAVLAVSAPWYVEFFDSGIAGCPKISRTGTRVPAQLVDQAISNGVAAGVTIAKR